MATLQQMIDLGYRVSPRGLDGAAENAIKSLDGFGGRYVVADDVISDELFVEASNRAAMYQKLVAARDVFSSNYANWATLTATQKDAANRQAQRALANLVRSLLGDLSSSGD